MSQEPSNLLVGYPENTRQILLKTCVICGVVCIVLIIFGAVASFPLLLATASLAGELWWRSKKPLKLLDNGLEFGEKLFTWTEIEKYTTWGPVGIPWTPIKIEGLTVYFTDGSSVSVYSRNVNYNLLLQKLKTLSYPSVTEPVWYCYPNRVIRLARYFLAFTFSIFLLLLISLKFVVIILGAVVAYFFIRSMIRSKREKGESLPKDAWIATAVGLVLFFLLFYVFENVFLLTLIGGLPVVVILWFPWQPPAYAIISDALFVDKKKAYPLRHLRSVRMISKFFVIKIWCLSFASGDVSIVPILENFEEFKTKLESIWNTTQKKYQGKKMTEEEAEIRTPEEEARKIHFFGADEISLVAPLQWQIMLPFFFLVHIILIFTCSWYLYNGPLGNLAMIGPLLQGLFPIFLIYYGNYLLFSLFPRILHLYTCYEISEDGIKVGQRGILWKQIHSIVPYQDLNGRKLFSLLDVNGKTILTIRQEMNDWHLALEKVKEEVQKAHKVNSIAEGAVAVMNKKSTAWKRSRCALILMTILLCLCFSMYNIIENKKKLNENHSNVAVAFDVSPFMQKIFKNLLLVSYQDYRGNIYHCVVLKKQEEIPLPTEIRIAYLVDNPLYILPYNEVESPLTSIACFLENRGLKKEQILFLETIVENMIYVFVFLMLLILFFSLLHQGIFAGIVSQKIPPPLGPSLYLPGTWIWHNFVRIVLHFLVLCILLFFCVSITFPAYLPFAIRIPFATFSIILTALFCIFFLIYLCFYLIIVFPEWLRSLKKWRLEEDGIKYKNQFISWNEIKSVAVFTIPSLSLIRFFRSKDRKIALISSDKKQICLEGELIHFDGIVSYIREKSKCKENNYSKAKYFLRRQYSIPRLAYFLTCIFVLVTLTFLINLSSSRQREVLANGSLTEASVIYSVGKICLLQYSDQNMKNWYTMGWKIDKNLQTKIMIDSENPAFWEELDWKICSFRTIFANGFSSLSDFLLKHDNWILEALKFLFWGCLIFLVLPCLWFLMGVLLGIPYKNIKEKEKEKEK